MVFNMAECGKAWYVLVLPQDSGFVSAFILKFRTFGCLVSGV